MSQSILRICVMVMCTAATGVAATSAVAQSADSASEPKTASAQPTLEEVTQKISELWDQHTSVVAKFVMTGRQSSRGMPLSVRTEGAFEYLKQTRGPLYRVESRTVTRVGEGESAQNGEGTLLMVDDGLAHYRLETRSERPGPIAIKLQSKPLVSARGGAKLFERIRKQNDLKLLPDDKLDGAECYVIEAQRRNDMPAMVKRSHFYFRKSDGIRVKYIGFGPDGLEAQTTIYSDIKVDTDIDPKRFEFEAPAGVRIIDRS